MIDFVGRLAHTPPSENDEIDNNNTGPIFQQAVDWIIVIGEKDVLPALEMGVRFLSVGETAAIWSHSKFAYGPSQRRYHGDTDYTLPPHSHVCYTVTAKQILSLSHKESSGSSTSSSSSAATQVQIAQSKKMIGNDIYAHEWFGNGEYAKQRAKQEYKRAAETMQYLLLQTTTMPQNDDDNYDDNNNNNNNNDSDASQQQEQQQLQELQEQARTIMLDCLNNIAALHLRAHEYKLAKEAAVQVLTHDPDNFKALIRAAKAALLDPASSYEEVDVAIQASGPTK